MVELSNFNEDFINKEHKTYLVVQSTKCMRENKNGAIRTSKIIANKGEIYSGIVEIYKKNMFLNIGLHPKIERNIYIPIILDFSGEKMINLEHFQDRIKYW